MVRSFKEFEQDGWWYRISEARNEDGYIILAKREMFVLSEFEPLLEPGELRFEFGETEENALDNIKIDTRKFTND